MNRLNRYFTLPLLFAAIAVTGVVVLGEPVVPVRGDVGPVELVLEVSEVDGVAPAEVAAPRSLSHRAASMRWRITLPTGPLGRRG